MNKLRLGLIGVAVIAVSSRAQAAPGVRCPTCDREVIVSWEGAKCLQRKLPALLGRLHDPILVSIANCGKASTDHRRQEPVPNPRSGRRISSSGVRMVYLLTRADAQCLYSRLRATVAKTSVVRVDLSKC